MWSLDSEALLQRRQFVSVCSTQLARRSLVGFLFRVVSQVKVLCFGTRPENQTSLNQDTEVCVPLGDYIFHLCSICGSWFH